MLSVFQSSKSVGPGQNQTKGQQAREKNKQVSIYHFPCQGNNKFFTYSFTKQFLSKHVKIMCKKMNIIDVWKSDQKFEILTALSKNELQVLTT